MTFRRRRLLAGRNDDSRHSGAGRVRRRRRTFIRALAGAKRAFSRGAGEIKKTLHR